MDLTGFLTSAGINTGVCIGLFSLYSVLRKQPSLASVYFGKRLSQVNYRHDHDPFWFETLLPSAGWLMKAWEASEQDLYVSGGVDAVVFLRAVVFSIRVFSVATGVCLFLVLPANYYGKEMEHKGISTEKLDVFGIGNVKVESKWLWVHCVALYIITSCSCLLLYFEYKNILEMRLVRIGESLSNPSHFTVIVRAIPRLHGKSYSETICNFFTQYYTSSYLAHQMVYETGAVRKLMRDAEKMYKTLKTSHLDTHGAPRFVKCGGCCGGTTSFKILCGEVKNNKKEAAIDNWDEKDKECGAALVFFKTRYAALVASGALQSSDPMSWVTISAPEPLDIYWSNLCVPFRLLWIRKIFVKVVSGCFVIFFLIPVVFTQSLVHLDKLQKIFPFIKDIARRVTNDYSSVFLFSFSMKIVEELISGYLPSVVFIMFLYIVAPLMMVFSAMEGAISRSHRKRSACIKVVLFVIWNVFFANILSEAALNHYQVSIWKLGDPKKIPIVLAKAVPSTATFFMTYVFTSGWASLSVELIQPFSILTNMFYRYILHNEDQSTYGTYTFPYHTEVPRVLLFGLLGFTYSIVAPLMLPFLMIYFILAFFVYRNQLMNVYTTEYDTGGQYWPIVHNTTIFSMLLIQVIATGFFGIKKAPLESTLIIPLIICTLLFHEYCRHKFMPIFTRTPVQTILEMDRKDDICGKSEEIHQKLQYAYCQFRSKSLTLDQTPEQDQIEIH